MRAELVAAAGTWSGAGILFQRRRIAVAVYPSLRETIGLLPTGALTARLLSQFSSRDAIRSLAPLRVRLRHARAEMSRRFSSNPGTRVIGEHRDTVNVLTRIRAGSVSFLRLTFRSRRARPGSATEATAIHGNSINLRLITRPCSNRDEHSATSRIPRRVPLHRAATMFILNHLHLNSDTPLRVSSLHLVTIGTRGTPVPFVHRNLFMPVIWGVLRLRNIRSSTLQLYERNGLFVP